jgi:hypothetical protein
MRHSVGRGFDVAFEIADGESPFVDPSLAAALAARNVQGRTARLGRRH